MALKHVQVFIFHSSPSSLAQDLTFASEWRGRRFVHKEIIPGMAIQQTLGACCIP